MLGRIEKMKVNIDKVFQQICRWGVHNLYFILLIDSLMFDDFGSI